MMDKEQAIVESILFAMGKPIEAKEIAQVMNLSIKEVEEVIEKLKEKYKLENSGIDLVKLDGKYQLCTKKEYYEYLIKLIKDFPKQELSQAALETLAIVAYKQPVTKSEINKIRGVNSDKALNRLIEYGLVVESGRQNVPGRPLLFATSDEFLRRFGVQNLEQSDIVFEKKQSIL